MWFSSGCGTAELVLMWGFRAVWRMRSKARAAMLSSPVACLSSSNSFWSSPPGSGALGSCSCSCLARNANLLFEVVHSSLSCARFRLPVRLVGSLSDWLPASRVRRSASSVSYGLEPRLLDRFLHSLSLPSPLPRLRLSGDSGLLAARCPGCPREDDPW
jgi:hypothetical protein